jgi:hypothetical protein
MGKQVLCLPAPCPNQFNAAYKQSEPRRAGRGLPFPAGDDAMLGILAGNTWHGSPACGGRGAPAPVGGRMARPGRGAGSRRCGAGIGGDGRDDGRKKHPAKELFNYHAAGLAGSWGLGGSSYIDAVILRAGYDPDQWTEPPDEEPGFTHIHYLLQTWRGDVSLVVTDAARIIEWVQYSAYGVPFGIPAGNASSNGANNVEDLSMLINWIGNEVWDACWDLNADGSVTVADYASYPEKTLGRGKLSWINNRIGYAGYQHAPELAGTKWHVRRRWLLADLSIFNRRDPHPQPYVDGPSLYLYAACKPLTASDPMGLSWEMAGSTYIGEPPRPSRPRTCETDVPGSRCANECANVTHLGFQDCDDAGRPYCCICTENIRNLPGLPVPWNIDGIVDCVDVHESVHVRQGCPFPSDPRTRACEEVEALEAELRCLRSKLGRCSPGPAGERCRQAYELMIRLAELQLEEARRRCQVVVQW